MNSRTLMLGAALCAAMLSSAALADDATRDDRPHPADDRPIRFSTGKQERAGAELYIAQHGDKVAGKTISLVVKDDTGAADVTKRLSEELIGNDHASVLMGFGLIPLALAVAPVSAEAKVPEVVDGRRDRHDHREVALYRAHVLHLASGFGADGRLCLKNNIKKVVTIVTDYGPGIDAEKWFGDLFKKGGGQITEAIRVPLRNPDFAPFLQRVKDDNPDAVFVFVPSGFCAIFMKQFVERGLDKSGVKLIGTGDVTDDDLLAVIGD